MASRARRCAAGIAIVVGLFGGASSAAGDQIESVSVALVAADRARIPERVVALARTEAARIYRYAGITLVWSDAPDLSVPKMTVNIVWKPTGEVRSIPESIALKSTDRRVLGVSPGHKNRGDLVAWAFYERILDLAVLLGVDPGIMLGHVIAHELGHLLLPYDAHSESGVMRAGWDKAQATNAIFANLRFTPSESALIRLSVTRMRAEHSYGDSGTP